MKGSAAALLGLIVIIAVIDSTQAGGHGMMKCKSYMKPPTDEDKEMFKKCIGDVKAQMDDSEDADKNAKKRKMGACVCQQKKIFVDDKFNKANFDAVIDASFTDAEKAGKVKTGVAACAKDGQAAKTNEELGTIFKCFFGSMKTACE